MVAAQRAALILNPHSGTRPHRAKPEAIKALLASAGLDLTVAIIGAHQDATELARDAVRQGFDTVVACGGDGTISAVASALVGTEAALGVLPFGTLNHFAKDLHIPVDTDEAVRVVARRKIEHVDIAEVNGTFFVNNSSLGIYPNIVIERERRRRTGWNKWIALGAATLHVLRRYPFMDVCIQAGGHSIARRTPFVFIGNNEYEIRGFNIGRRDALNLGRLYLYVAAPVSRPRLIGMAIAALFGRIGKTGALELFSLPEAWIDTPRRRVRVSTDGEVRRFATPLHYVLRSRALKVIVP